MIHKFKPCFFVKSHSHRPDFPGNMTDDEKAVMQRHSAFWDELLLNGGALATGPVQDPNGSYGIGIVFAEDENAARELLKDDPAQKIADYSYAPMLVNYLDNPSVKES